MGMRFTKEMIAEDEKRWHARDVVTELGYCSTYMRDRKDMTNLDIRFYAYIMRRAHEMLKAQEPRLLTLEEADKAPYVWLESKEGGLGVRKIRIVPVDSTAVSIQTFGRPDTIGNIHEFEKRFRCWNIKPSDEQRQNEPWKE